MAKSALWWSDPVRLAMPVHARGLGCVAKIRVVHIGRRVIEAQPHLAFVARSGELLDDVLTVGRIRDLVFGVLGIEHAESVVMLGREDHILLPSCAGEVNPFVGVKPSRIEAFPQRRLFGLSNTARLWHHNGPRCLHTCQGIEPPVNEHSELRLPVPLRSIVNDALCPPTGRGCDRTGS